MESLILVLNCGSSSVKGVVIEYKTGQIILSCLAEKLNLTDATIKFNNNEVFNLKKEPNHEGALKVLFNQLNKLNIKDNLLAIGHRIVHGGEKLTSACLITDEVEKEIQKCIPLAPLHNPAHLLGIKIAKDIFKLPQVAVFDTAFHQTIPKYAYLYAIDYKFYEKYALRKYGMHGISYRYVSQTAKNFLEKKTNLSLVIAHLGNGASISAIVDGISLDTSMGLTPLEGLIMGTRSGDIDPSIFSFLNQNLNLSINEITSLLNKKSGLLGISGISNDYRLIEEKANQGNKRAKLALKMFAYRLSKYVASMTVAAGNIDALIFTGGIGENSHTMRANVLNNLKFMGFQIDEKKNLQTISGNAGIITKGNPIALVIPTNEELMIARDTAQVIGLE